MATLNTTNQLGLVELAKRKGPQGNLLAIAEVLAEDNEIIQDMTWVEANDTASHKSIKRASLPSGTWRKLNDGVGKEASETIEVVDTIGMLETWSEVDVDLVKMAPNPAKFRSDESLAFVEGLSQNLSDTAFYGNANVDTEQFTGHNQRGKQLESWSNALHADWGRDFHSNRQTALKGLEVAGENTGNQLRDLLNTSGALNNPAVMKFLHAVGTLMKEDSFVRGAPRPVTIPRDPDGRPILNFRKM